MAGISDNKYDVCNWIIKVIDSCKNLDHINNTQRLINRFRTSSRDSDMYSKLHVKLNIKTYSLKHPQMEISKEEAKSQLIQLLQNQIMDLSMMSKIELGDDVIDEILRLKAIINE
jgi:hypothetical protein